MCLLLLVKSATTNALLYANLAAKGSVQEQGIKWEVTSTLLWQFI